MAMSACRSAVSTGVPSRLAISLLKAASGTPADTPTLTPPWSASAASCTGLEISSMTCFASPLRSIAAEPIAEDDAELIAAEPRHGSPLHNSRQALGDHLENFVAE